MPHWLRNLLFIGFGGLLAILVVAGFTSLRTLRKLQTAEEDGHSQYLTRIEILTRVTSLVQTYNRQAERYVLMSAISVISIEVPPGFGEQVTEALAVMEAYPGTRDPAEQLLLEEMQRQLAEEEGTVPLILSWSPEQRRHGAQLLDEVLIPEDLKVLETTQQIEALEDKRLNDALLRRFGVLQERLTLVIFFALAAAMLLSVLSARFILRLERQAQERYRELARSRRDLKELSAELVDAQETERRSLSRELHDEVGQSLAALVFELRRLSKPLPPDSPPIQEQLGEIKTMAENTASTVRNMALLLRPSMLDDLGLVAALEWQGREVSRRTEMEVDVQAQGVSESLPDEYKVCVYRVVQEALNNAARHASARTASVSVVQDSRRILVTITDRGRGFDTRRVRGFGLVGMEERVKRLGGGLTIDSEPGQGTTVKAELPPPVGTGPEQPCTKSEYSSPMTTT